MTKGSVSFNFVAFSYLLCLLLFQCGASTGQKSNPVLEKLLAQSQPLSVQLWSLSTLISMFTIFENTRASYASDFSALSTFATSSFTSLQGQAYLGNPNAVIRYYSLILLALITRWTTLEPNSALSCTLEDLLRADQNLSVRLATCCMSIHLIYTLM